MILQANNVVRCDNCGLPALTIERFEEPDGIDMWLCQYCAGRYKETMEYQMYNLRRACIALRDELLRSISDLLRSIKRRRGRK